MRAVREAQPYGPGAEPARAGLSEGQLLQLGWMHAVPNIPESSYVRRDILKRPGTTRIGLFGGSFVEGLESGRGYDLASFLERRFRRAGTRNVEVVNFGTFAYGMHQSYLLWGYLGRRFGLDYAFFFPEYFYIQGDESFIFQEQYASVHARYVLSGEGIELMPVIGGDRIEAVKQYNRLLTPWRYARFDYRPPLAVRLLLPPERRRGINPFYYWPLKLIDEEIEETYVRIFASIAAQGGRPIVWTHSQELADSLRARLGLLHIPLEHSDIWKIMERAPEVYSAPVGHLSPIGNEVQAEELYSFITGDPRPRATLIELSALDQRLPDRIVGRPLDQYDALAIGVGSHRLAGLVTVLHGKAPPPILAGLQDMKAAALLTTAPPDAVLAPVPVLLDNEARVFAVLESDGGIVRVPLGRLHAPSRVIGTIVLDASFWEGRWSNGGRWSLQIQNGDWFRRLSVFGDRRLKRVTIESGGITLLESGAKNTGPVEFRSHFAELLRIRAVPDGYVDVRNLPAQGALDLLGRRNGKWSGRFPLFSYTIRNRLLAPFATSHALRL
jgi:hypothetical protein